MLYSVFFKKCLDDSDDYEFIAPDLPEVAFSASSIEEGIRQAKMKMVQELQNNFIQPTEISVLLGSDHLKGSLFSVVEIEPNHLGDIIDKVTISFPRSQLKRIEEVLLKNPSYKSRSGFLLKATEDLLKKEEEVYMLKDVRVSSLNSLRDDNPAYYPTKFAYIHTFIEYAKRNSKNYVDLLVHNLTPHEVRNYHPYSFPFNGDRIFLENESNVKTFLENFKQKYEKKGFQITQEKYLENGSFKYWLFRIFWDSNISFLDTEIAEENYTWCNEFVRAYLKSEGVIMDDSTFDP
ncbi:hypothetical protein ACIN8IBEIGE_20253 [Acinetobacter sp. 8I-beige]|uniref:type II toxin-antitoxin system HicB family antitoxin n=1 Tax=Acinetobacter sp. 8I-beige TaxID=2653125 RepID=UPI0012F09B43|nr:type II toxin-antitoxin system HicB family antitoxin [Acinetobacter sp. 8I-beige]VXA84836.1 hypothetical protein ACIN8IBEIGE_20253 [Acinetobacter sp. 8I-beige]